MNLVLWRHLPTLQNSWWLWRAQQQSFRISHVAVTQKQESAAAEISSPTQIRARRFGNGEGRRRSRCRLLGRMGRVQRSRGARGAIARASVLRLRGSSRRSHCVFGPFLPPGNSLNPHSFLFPLTIFVRSLYRIAN